MRRTLLLTFLPATAAAVLGLVVPGVYVENVETTAKTMPEYVQLWRSMLEGR